MNRKISIVIPCHNEADNIVPLYDAIESVIPKNYRYEVILVDDGSRDLTREIIRALATRHNNITGIFFHRQSGHQAALKAGILAATGDAVITMDGDFQHPPETIATFIEKWEAGADLVIAQKREDPSSSVVMKVKRAIGYRIWDIVSDGRVPPRVSDFRLMDKAVVAFVNQSKEHELFLRGLVTLAARKTVMVPYSVGSRLHGRSSYNTKMFVHLFMNGFVSFSIKPLRVGWMAGIVVFLLSGAYIVFDITVAILTHRAIIEGWTTIVALLFAMNSAILIYLGIIAEYVGIIFKEVKSRPQYIIDEQISSKE
jgi:dolichol-phosphate mannosyltransferase